MYFDFHTKYLFTLIAIIAKKRDIKAIGQLYKYNNIQRLLRNKVQNISEA
jgi:hypothetical protein